MDSLKSFSPAHSTVLRTTLQRAIHIKMDDQSKFDTIITVTCCVDIACNDWVIRERENYAVGNNDLVHLSVK